VIGATFTETKEDAFANLKVRFADIHFGLLQCMAVVLTVCATRRCGKACLSRSA
jgi:hypothetical protein